MGGLQKLIMFLSRFDTCPRRLGARKSEALSAEAGHTGGGARRSTQAAPPPMCPAASEGGRDRAPFFHEYFFFNPFKEVHLQTGREPSKEACVCRRVQGGSIG